MKKYEIVIEDKTYVVQIDQVVGDTASINVDGVSYEVKFKDLVEKPKITPAVERPPAPEVSAPVSSRSTPNPSATAVVSESGLVTVVAPLPGLVLDVLVDVGDRVEVGDVVVVIEAMKMENKIQAPRGGIVKEIKVSKDKTVLEGDLLMTIEE